MTQTNKPYKPSCNILVAGGAVVIQDLRAAYKGSSVARAQDAKYGNHRGHLVFFDGPPSETLASTNIYSGMEG